VDNADVESSPIQNPSGVRWANSAAFAVSYAVRNLSIETDMGTQAAGIHFRNQSAADRGQAQSLFLPLVYGTWLMSC
jgi:hypothetical protein